MTINKQPAGESQKAPGRLSRSVAGMAIGTIASRLTGIARLIALAYALGVTRAADAYNLANTTPNIIYDLVLGGIISATFIPVFVDNLAKDANEDEAWEAISAVVSLAAVLLVVATIIFELAAPALISLYTITNHSATAGLEREVATDMLRLFAPQLLLYGLFSLATALLNVRRKFSAPMFAPVLSNLVTIGVLLATASLMHHPTLEGLHRDTGVLVLVSLGTTVGISMQLVALIPSLRSSALRLKWKWAPTHPMVRSLARLSSWTFGIVLGNQVALFVVLTLADGLRAGSVSAYTYAYTFFQLPFAIIAISVMSALTPELAQRWATGDFPGFRHYFSQGMRAIMAIVLPAAIGLILLAAPLVALLLAHGAAGRSTVSGTGATAGTLAVLATGLPGFCLYLYAIRVFQSMQDLRTAFWLYLLENGLNIVLAFLLSKPLGVKGLALSLVLAYSFAALIAIAILNRKAARGHHGVLRELSISEWRYLLRAGVSSFAMAVAVELVNHMLSGLHGAGHGWLLLARTIADIATGIVAFAVVAILASTVLARITKGHLTNPASKRRSSFPGGYGKGRTNLQVRGRIDLTRDYKDNRLP